jgi:hydrogenase-4 component F
VASFQTLRLENSFTVSPTFSLFVSEFAILSEAFSQSRYLIGGVFLIVLSVVFGGFLYHLMRMISGAPQAAPPAKPHIARAEFAVMVVTGICLLYFGIRIPAAFSVLLHEAVTVLQ